MIIFLLLNEKALFLLHIIQSIIANPIDEKLLLNLCIKFRHFLFIFEIGSLIFMPIITLLKSALI